MKIKTCRICLVMDVKMFHLGHTKVKDFIGRVFNQYGFNQNLNDLHYVCYECRALLEKTFEFIQRVLRAQQVLFDMLKEKGKISQSDLRNLDRHKLGLNNNLSKQMIGIDFHINEDACNGRSSNNMNYVAEEQSLCTTLCPYTGFMIKDEDELDKNKYFKEIAPDVLCDPLANAPESSDIIILDSDDESTVTNNQSVIKKNELKLNPYSDRYILKTSNGKNQSDNVKQDTSKAIPKTEKIKSDAVEHECYVEIKIEELPDPLIRTSHTVDISVEPKMCNIVTNETKDNIIADSLSCTVKSCGTEINKGIIFHKEPNQDGSLPIVKTEPNIKKNLPATAVDDDWCPGYKPKKSKKPKKIQSKTKYVKKKTISKTSTFIESVQKVIENDVDKTVRRKEAKYVFSDVSDGQDNIHKKKEDDEYRPTSSGESDDSIYDMFDDVGRRLKRPDDREYPRQCDHCNFEVPVRKEHFIHYLRFHKDIEYPYGNKSRFICQYCGKTSKTEQQHRDHELSHGEKTVQCTKCSKMFTSATRMQSHSRVVHCTKLYECDYCGKLCKTRSDLCLHMRIHTGEKPFTCHICGAEFAHSGNRTIHIRTNHQQSIVYPKNKKRKNRKYMYTSPSADSSEDECITKKKRKVNKTKRKIKTNKIETPI